MSAHPEHDVSPPPLHHYPDPDYAACANKYPWVRGDDHPPNLSPQQRSFEAWHRSERGPPSADEQDLISRWNDDTDWYKKPIPSHGERLFDPDFHISDDPVT